MQFFMDIIGEFEQAYGVSNTIQHNYNTVNQVNAPGYYQNRKFRMVLSSLTNGRNGYAVDPGQ